MKLSRDTEDQESRRDFVRAAGRALGLAALGMIAWAAGFRHAGPGVGERRSRCRRCRMLSVCSLPGALHVRDTLGVQQDLSKLDHIDLTDRLCTRDSEA